MSLLFIEGFDHYDDTALKWDLTPGSTLAPDIQTGGRFGGNYLEIQDNTINEVVKFITPSDEVICGIALKFAGNHNWIMRFRDGNGVTIATHETEGTGGQMWQDLQDSGTDLGSYTSAFTTNVWQYLEVRVKVETGGGGNGEIEVRVNGAIVLSNTGISIGTEQIGQIFLRAEHQEANNCNLDDMYVLNTLTDPLEPLGIANTFLGDVRVTVKYPDLNGNTNNFFPSTVGAPNFTMVNEVTHDGDTSYVEAGQLAATEHYETSTFDEIGFAAGTIYGLQVVNSALKTDAGALHYKDRLVMSGVAFDGVADVIATAVNYKMSTERYDTDPRDNSVWSEAKTDDAGCGCTITLREV